jgi:hypothetical protein
MPANRELPGIVAQHDRVPQQIENVQPAADPGMPPPRPERHLPNAIATLSRRLIVALVERLPRCPGCGSGRATGVRRNL